jgi:hypothetical protein
MTRADRRAYKAALRADASGAGPTLEERLPARYPGAKGSFALFGEVLATGLLVTAASLPIVTIPAALAAGVQHIRRYLNAEASPVRAFWKDVRIALPGGLAVGVATALIAAVLIADILLANTGALPGGGIIAAIGWVGLVALGTALMLAAGAWSADAGWAAAVRSVPSTAGADPIGVLYLAATAVFVGVITWMLIPLIIAGLGCAATAVVAIPARRFTR